MPGRLIRSKIAEQVSEIIGSRQGRSQLSAHGWVQGMPVVIAQPEEKLSDVMSLVAAHQPPALIATLNPQNSDLWFMYVSIGCTSLQIVEPLSSTTTLEQFYHAASAVGVLTFRIAQMPASSVVHAIEPQRTNLHPGYPAATSASVPGN